MSETPRSTFIDVSHCDAAFVEDVKAHIEANKEPPPDATFSFPESGVFCFHCGKTFKTYRGALMHFGETPTKTASASCITYSAPDPRVSALIETTCGRLLNASIDLMTGKTKAEVDHNLRDIIVDLTSALRALGETK